MTAKLFAAYLIVGSMVLAGLASWGLFGLTKHTIVLIDTWANVAPKPHAVDPVIGNLNQATGAWAASSKQQAQSAAAIERDVRVQLWQLNRYWPKLSAVTDNLTQELGFLQQTTNAATDLTQALETDAETANGTIAAAKPVLDNYAAAGADLDRLLKSQDLAEAISGVAGTSQNVKKLSGDLYVYAHPILNPDPCLKASCRWKKVLNTAGAVAGFGSNLYGAKSLVTPVAVRLQK